MARKTLPQKGVRVVEFLLGLGYQDIGEIMAARGMDEEEIGRGWSLVRGLVRGRAVTSGMNDAGRAIGDIEDWQREHFVILDATLRRHYPKVHAVLCDRVAKADGTDGVVAMRVLLDHLDAVLRPPAEGGMADAPAALALLAKRGTGPEALDALRAMVHRATSLGDADDEIDPDDVAASEQAMWDWYLEWSLHARIAIKDQRMLAALGFRKGRAES